MSTISVQKYNTWCEKRPLVCTDKGRIQRAQVFSAQRDLTPFERAAFYLHELVGCEGLEFVAFSNAKLQKPVLLSDGVILVPCFLNDLEGKDVQDTFVQLAMTMESKCRFIYDGWIPITTWDVESVRKAVRDVQQALSLFCLRGRTFFEWEPKYLTAGVGTSYYKFEERHLLELEGVASALDSLDENDRVAIYRSLGWLSQGLVLNEPAARFLFSILAIEALATYIEEEVVDESPLSALRTERITRSKRRSRRNECINNIVRELLEHNPTKAITTAYFDCIVGIKQRLKAHLEKVFKSNNEAILLLFEQEIEGKSLYALRHDIAHGTADALSELQRTQILQRVWDAERIARRYILAVLNLALGVEHFSEGINATQPLGILNMITSREGMYKGPTHMAIIYS